MASWLDVRFAGHDMVLDADLALWWPERDVLVVSDLHLEKSTFLAQFGSSVAPYDTLDTLLRLESLVARYRPKSLILLGDSFHDRGAWARLESAARRQIEAISASVETCHLVEGNHDLGLAHDAMLSFADDVRIDNVIFKHEPGDGLLPQVVGHYHPKVRMSLRGQRLSGKCFAVNDSLLIMPAFGSFTGGLDVTHEVFANLAAGDPLRPYLVYRQTVVAVETRGR